MLKVLVLFGLCIGFVFPRYFIVGPAALRIINSVPCPEYFKLPGTFVLNKRMYNQTTEVYDGFISVPMDLDDNVTVSVKCSRVDKRKKQVNSFALDDAPFCRIMKQYIGDLWTDLQPHIGMKPEPEDCLIKMGNYSVENVVIDLNKLNVQMLLEGVFSSRVLIKNGSKPLYCGDFTIQLYPKKE